MRQKIWAAVTIVPAGVARYFRNSSEIWVPVHMHADAIGQKPFARRWLAGRQLVNNSIGTGEINSKRASGTNNSRAEHLNYQRG
jgi:hypothetical protein